MRHVHRPEHMCEALLNLLPQAPSPQAPVGIANILSSQGPQTSLREALSPKELTYFGLVLAATELFSATKGPLITTGYSSSASEHHQVTHTLVKLHSSTN